MENLRDWARRQGGNAARLPGEGARVRGWTPKISYNLYIQQAEADRRTG